MGSWNGGAAELGRPSREIQLKSTRQLRQTDLAMGDDAKLQEIQKLGGTAIKPVGWDRTGWEAFQYMLWNPDTGEVLTRTPLSWLKITVFYCIFIKLNTIWGWTPKPYDCAAEKAKGDESEGPCLPEVEEHIKAQGADAANNVYVNCRGRYAADQEALKDGLTYFPPNQGLPIKYFPYQGKGKMAGGNYHAPLVAVKISPREGHGGQLIHIECRAYYDGVKHVTKTKEGMVMFELQIKDL